MADLNNNGIDDALEGAYSPETLALINSFGISTSPGTAVQGQSIFPGLGMQEENAWVRGKAVPKNKAIADFYANTTSGQRLRDGLRSRLENLGYSDLDNAELGAIYKKLVDQSADQLAVGYKQTPDELFGLFYTGKTGTGEAQSFNNLVRNIARTSVQLGVKLSDKQIKSLASQAQSQGWDAATLGEKIAGTGKVTGEEGVAAETINRLKEYARDYGVAYDETWYQQATNSILENKATMETFEQSIKNVAKSRYGAFAEQIDAGLSPMQIASPYIQAVSSVLELDPNSVSLNDPLISKALTNVTEDGKPSVTPLWQFERELKQDPRWRFTKNAQQELLGTGLKLLKDFGVMA